MVWLQPTHVAVPLVLLSFVMAAPEDSQAVIAKLDQEIEQHIHTGLAAVNAAKEADVTMRKEKAAGRAFGDTNSFYNYYKAEQAEQRNEKYRQIAEEDLGAAKAEKEDEEVLKSQAQAIEHRNI